MSPAEILLAVLLQRPVYKDDKRPEDAPAKAAQLQRVATAIVATVKPPAGINRWDWTALVAAIGEEETHWSLRIGRNECRKWECDPLYRHGVLVEYRAVGYWQPHKNKFNADVWAQLAGGEGSELVQAQNANDMLVRGYWTCARSGVPWLQATINGYAGKQCGSSWDGLGKRMFTWKKIRQRLP
jgi:hypothetical protein